MKGVPPILPGTPELNPINELMRVGRFRDALSGLRKLHVRPETPLYETYSGLLSEVLQLTGNNKAAEDLASEALGARGAKPFRLAKSHLVLGTLCREYGELDKAVSHLNRSCHFAEMAGNLELQCWSQIRLMSTAEAMHGADIAIGMLPEVRRNVLRLADPYVMAMLHICVAEFESKRGYLASASRHIQLAHSILERHPNVWLAGSAAIDEFCVSYLRSDIRAAMAFASNALSHAAESGHAATKMAACTNLAHLRLVSGDLVSAEALFNEALDSCDSRSVNVVAILDGLAQLELARNSFERSEKHLNQIATLEATRIKSPGYYESWSFRTRLQLLIAQRNHEAALTVCREIQPQLSRFHPTLRLALTGLKADALLLSGDLNAARDVIGAAYSDSSYASPEISAHLELTLGKILLQSNLHDHGAAHLRRSARIFKQLQHLSAETSALAAAATTSPRSETAGQTADFSLHGAIVRQLKSLVDFRESPELFARESVEFITRLDCADGVFISNESNEEQHVPTGQANLVVKIGAVYGKELRLTVRPKTDLISRINAMAACNVLAAIIESREMRRIVDERAEIWPPDDVTPSTDVVCVAPVMQDIFRTVQKLGRSNVTVLITGETGTGKEILARELHRQSGRDKRPFVPFNCSAVPRELVESQLFGHRRGAFSGAHDNFEGVIRAASGGTLFLDEIGDVSIDVQPKLLRFLESSEVHPLGEVRHTKVDVRVIAASNANVEQSVAEGRFRDDLYYRLNIVRFRVPPLRERKEEIPQLVGYFVKKFANEYSKSGISISDEALETLLIYRWPGNVRQLANEIRRVVALADNGSVITPNHLSPDLNYVPAPSHFDQPALSAEIIVQLDQPLQSAVDFVERSMLSHVLRTTRGRVEPAAKALGLSRKGLYLKRMRLGLIDFDGKRD